MSDLHELFETEVVLLWDVDETLTVGSTAHVDLAINPAFREVFPPDLFEYDASGPFVVLPNGVWFIGDDPYTTPKLNGSIVTDILYGAADKCGFLPGEAREKIRVVIQRTGEIWSEIARDPYNAFQVQVQAVEGVYDFLQATQQFPNIYNVIVTGSPAPVADTNLEVAQLARFFRNSVKATGDQGLEPGISNRTDLITKAIRDTEEKVGKSLRPVYLDDSIRGVTAGIEVPCPTVGVPIALADPVKAARDLAGGENPRPESPRADLVIRSFSPAMPLLTRIMELAVRGPVPLNEIQTEFFGLEGIDRKGANR